MHKRILNRGMGLVEIIVGAAIISVVMFGLLSVAQQSLKLTRQTANTVKGMYLMEEGVEALRTIRDRGYTANIASLSTNTTYYLAFTNGMWSATTTATTTDAMYYRTFTIGNVYRDGNSDIAVSGSLDAGTKSATVTVAWQSAGTGTTTRSTATYITNLLSN